MAEMMDDAIVNRTHQSMFATLPSPAAASSIEVAKQFALTIEQPH